MRPFLIFGLGGTLLERMHPRSVPAGAPAPDLTVGFHKVWLRPNMMQTLLALQTHCDLAIWSSTTARNTNAVVDAVFRSGPTGDKGAAAQASPAPEEKGKRFQKRDRKPSGSGSDTPGALDLKFVWAREHTVADDFRRLNAVVNDDSHATVKDLHKVFEAFPTLATPQNTVLIDDTPSKAKNRADNFIWLDTFDVLKADEDKGILLLKDFIESKIVGAKDVRAVLPVHMYRS